MRKDFRRSSKSNQNDINLKQNELLTPLGYYIASELFIEIVEGVHFLREESIIHRDFKILFWLMK